MVIRSILVLLCLSCFLGLLSSGCTVPRNMTLTNFRRSYAPVEPDSVEITTLLLKPPYLEVGHIYVEDNTMEKATLTAKQRAAEVGGTMIVDARAGLMIRNVGTLLVIPLFDKMYFVKGVVVRRRDPVR